MLSHVEVIHIEACPSWKETGMRLRRALNESSFSDVAINYRLVNTVEEALAAGFSGSPTILFDGIDVFPTADRPTALACRLFLTEQGLSGMPTMSQLTNVIRAHA